MLNKVCVVGAGYWGKNHISTLHKLGALGGVVDTNNEKLNLFKKKYPDIQTYRYLNDALIKSDFNGFTVATPAQTHYTIAKQIIESGKSVLIEKPFVTDQAQAEDLLKISKKRSVNVMVGHLLLFHPAIQKIKQIIDRQDIGSLTYIYSNRINFGKVRSFENVLWSFGPHDISIFQYLLGSYPEKIHASCGIPVQKNIQDSVILSLQYSNGICGHIFTSWLHPFKEHRLVILGTNGMISFEDTIEHDKLKLYDKKIEIQEGKIKEIDKDYRVINYDESMPLTEQLRYFIGNLNGGKIEVSSAAQALDVTKILLEANKQISN